MVNGIRQQAIVGKGGKIEILSPELPIGATVEVIVLIETSSPKATHNLNKIIISSKEEPSWDDFFNQFIVFGNDFLVNRKVLSSQNREPF